MNAMHGWMDRWMGGWMDGWMDGATALQYLSGISIHQDGGQIVDLWPL